MSVGRPRFRVDCCFAPRQRAPHPDESRLRYFVGRNASGQLLGSLQYVRTACRDLVGSRLRRQHPSLPQPDRLKRGGLHQESHSRRNVVHLLQCGKYNRASILPDLPKANLPGKAKMSSRTLFGRTLDANYCDRWVSGP